MGILLLYFLYVIPIKYTQQLRFVLSNIDNMPNTPQILVIKHALRPYIS